jgi:hypothetical protein
VALRFRCLAVKVVGVFIAFFAASNTAMFIFRTETISLANGDHKKLALDADPTTWLLA